MSFVTRILATGTALVALSGAALAADLDLPILVDQAPEYKPVEIGNGWYLRGDIGYSVSTSSGPFHYRTFDPVTRAYDTQNFRTGYYDDDMATGVGVGYQFNNYLRMDATADYFKGSFFGSTEADSPCTGDLSLVGTTCETVDRQPFSAYQVMANAYVDLGTYAHFTPYVGAGVGYTYLNGDTLNNALYCVDGVRACPDPRFTQNVSHEGLADWRFTYSLMAGVSYQTSENLSIDLGYRYSKIAGGDMFLFDSASQAVGAAGPQGFDKGLERHEIRAGIRYSLW